MQRVRRCLVIGVLCCFPVLVVAQPCDAGSPIAPSDASADVLSEPLVIPGSPGEAEQHAAEELAKQNDPEAAAIREASSVAFENLAGAEAQHEIEAAFPRLVDEPAGGPPKLQAGQHITSFPSNDSASLDLGDGRHGVVESTDPMSVEGAPGQRTPIDLTIHEEGADFRPAVSATEVQIPRRLADGVGIEGSGIATTLTLVDEHGIALEGSSGAIAGDIVLYTNTQTDTDAVAKPTPAGIDVGAILRSQQSPRQIRYSVSVPSGASLIQPAGSQAILVELAGRVVAVISAASARDAAGIAVPVSTTLSGHTLTLTIDRTSGQVEYPIFVDPEVTDGEIFSGGNWAFATNGQFATGQHESCCEIPEKVLSIMGFPPYTIGHFGVLDYPTQGESHIFRFAGTTFQSFDRWQLGALPEVTGTARIEKQSNQVEGPTHTLEEGVQEYTLCPGNCGPEAVTALNQHNAVLIQDTAVANSEHAPCCSGVTEVSHVQVSIEQDKGPSEIVDTTDQTIEGKVNALYPGTWSSLTAPTKESFAIASRAYDPGIGVDFWGVTSPTNPEWGFSPAKNGGFRAKRCKGFGVQCDECDGMGQSCESGSATQPLETSLTEASQPSELPEGEDAVETMVEDAAGLKSATSSATIKIDDAAPHNITLAGLPANHEVGDGTSQLKLQASATDGSGSTKSSGVASLALTVDSQQLGKASGKCSPGPCTATSEEWTQSVEELGAGKHTLIVTATDNVGNVASEAFTLTVHHAAPVSLGPGAVNPVTGELSLAAADVSIVTPGAPLVVNRTYRSRHLSSGAEGPLGPQWSMGVGAQQTLAKTPSGSVLLTTSSGQAVFTSNGKGGYTPPAGDANLSLSERITEGVSEYLLRASGGVVIFRHATNGEVTKWYPAEATGAGGASGITYTFKTVKGITEPTQELAPVPAGITCPAKLAKGCRALTFNYATTKTATGEAPSEWGDYIGRLTRVYYVAWDPAKAEMTTTEVAHYAYDSRGRLRAEWDPRVSPALKRTYGYDSENHITAESLPGREPWLFHYGSSPTDANNGRIASVIRPGASTALGAAEAPSSTAAPTLSSTKPTVGIKLSVSSNGSWTNAPLAYGYQWERCSAAGKECAAIPGAINQSYYPASADAGRTLMAAVSATNADGTSSAVSAVTSLVASGTPTNTPPEPPSPGTSAIWTIDYKVPLSGAGAPHEMGKHEVEAWSQQDDPSEATAIFPPDEPEGWPAQDYRRATVDYFDQQSRAVNTAAPSGGMSTTEYNEYNDVTRTLSADNRQAALNEGAKSAEASKLLDEQTTYGSEGTVLLSTLGPQHAVKLSNGSQALARESTKHFYDEGAPEGGPFNLVTKTTRAALVAGKEEDIQTILRSYGGQNNLGWKLGKPTSTTIDPSGADLVHTVLYDPKTGNVTETRKPAAGAVGQESGYFFGFQFGKEGTTSGRFVEPKSIAVDGSSDVWVADSGNNRLQVFSENGKHIKNVSKLGTNPGEVKHPQGITFDAKGNLWVADTGNNRLEEWSSTGAFKEVFAGIPEVPGSLLKEPEGVAIDAEGNAFIADTGDHRIVKYWRALTGEEFFWGNTATFGQSQLSSPSGIAIGAEGNIYVTDAVKNSVFEYTHASQFVRSFGSTGSGNGQLKEPGSVATDSAGNVWVADRGNDRIEEFGPTGTFLQVFGKEGTGEAQLNAPVGVAIDPQGNAWVADTGNDRVQQWTPHGSGYDVGGKPTAHDTQTIYYSAGANAQAAACGEHPEWAGLACQRRPAAQPEGGLPPLATTTTTAYNVWLEPLTSTSTAGTSTRTVTDTYDEGARPSTSAISSSVGAPLPTVTNEYSPETGELKAQHGVVEGKEETLSSTSNTLGQLTSYRDADGNESTYKYDVDGRPEAMNDGKGSQSVTYDTTTGEPTKLVDSAAGTFTAGWDVGGNMTSEGYPNGMTASLSVDPAGVTTSLQYVKTTHCTTGCTLFSESILPTSEGKTATKTSTLANENDRYDPTGRLVEVQSTPSGQGCTTRLYSFDPDTNRSSVATRPPGPNGECTAEGGAVEKHTDDQADRLSDLGVAYDPFGNVTALPATDAGGSELTSAFYADNQLQSQTQNGQTLGYRLDPSGRTRETVATGKTSSDVISHFAGDGDSPAWTLEATSGSWTRNIAGIDGGLAAVQHSGEAPVLQLSNLHGDVVATASLSETETKLLSTNAPTEYGVPSTTTPPKYGWLGGDERSTELPSGVIAMGARSYVPQLGRFLQEDPAEGGSANAYAYTFGDPVNSADPSGEYTATVEEWAWLGSERAAGEAVEAREAELAAIKAAEEAAARAEAEHRAAAAAGQRAAECATMGYLEQYATGCAPSLLEIMASRGDGAAGREVIEAGGGGSTPRRFANFEYCLGGCHTTTAQEQCLKKAGNNKSRASKCFPGEHGRIGELGEALLEVLGIVECIYRAGDCPDYGGAPHPGPR
jgi:RHS repeat-associated protein